VNALTYPLHSLHNHRLRSILTAASIGAAVASLLALVGLSRGVDRAIVVSVEDRGTDIVAVRKGSVEIFTSDVDQSLGERIRAIPGVIGVLSSMGDIIELESGETTYIEGWSTDGDFWQTLKITAGTPPDPSDMNSVVLGQALADILGKRPGDRIELVGKSFRISAISKQASVIDDRSVMMPLASMQQLLDREGKVSGFHIRVDRPGDSAHRAQVLRRLRESFPQLAFVESSEMANYVQITGVLRAMAWASSIVALVMAFAIVLNTQLMAVAERMRDMGLLSAIGWTPARVITSVIMEGVLLSLAGCVAGVALGLLGLRLLIKSPEMGTFLQPDVTLGLVLQSVGMVMAIGALGGLYPAWRATRIRPTELLRAE
jgi:putative ABC transport system permease protein